MSLENGLRDSLWSYHWHMEFLTKGVGFQAKQRTGRVRLRLPPRVEYCLAGPNMSQAWKRKKRPAAEKLRIMLAAMQPNVEVSELCRREGINPTQYYG